MSKTGGKAKNYPVLIFFPTYFIIWDFFKRLAPDAPYLIKDSPIAPHITGCGILLIVQSL